MIGTSLPLATLQFSELTKHNMIQVTIKELIIFQPN